MNKEHKIWLFEQYAQKMWTLAQSLMKEAARTGGDFGRSYAVVANECHNMTKKIFAYVAEVRFNNNNKDAAFQGIADAALQMTLLAVNAELELLRDKAANNTDTTRSIAVCVGDIRGIALEIVELAEKKSEQKPFIIPEIISPIKSTEISEYFFKYSIGGVSLVENTGIISTVEYPAKSDVGDRFNLRGLDVRVIDLYKRFNLKKDESDRQTVLIIHLDENNNGWKTIYAVAIDDLDVNAIFQSKIGCNAPPDKSHVFADYTRECWDAVAGGQLVFVDWQKLIS